jgi:tRNA threonylcarbamoyladenosine biosynthesis protein TsaB
MDQHAVSQVAVAIDARMGEIYWGCYGVENEGVPTLLGEEYVCSGHSVTLPHQEGEWVGAGTGWKDYADVLKARLNITTYWSDCYPRAGDIAMLGALAYRQGDIVNPEQALPVYLRDVVAKKIPTYAPLG